GLRNTLVNQSRKIADRRVRKHANRDLRRTGIERKAERLAALIRDRDERPRSDAVIGNNVGAVDPDVARFQARRATWRDSYGWQIRLCGSRRHKHMVMPENSHFT